MDPDHLGQRFDEGDFALHAEPRVREDGFGEDVLDEGEGEADVHVFDVEGGGGRAPGVEVPDLREVGPVVAVGVLAKSCTYVVSYMYMDVQLWL